VADWLISWSLRHRVAVLLAAVAVAVAGVVSVGRIAFDAFPDTTPVQVQINTTAPALVPEEIERLITFPVELAVGGLPGLVQLRSVSQFGLSSVVVTFADGTDIYFARQVIHERMAAVEMPIGVERPKMGPVATGLGEIFQYTLSSDELSLTELRTLHDWVVKPKMRSVPGVAEINSWGGLEKQYQIRIDPARLVAHDISFHEVVTAVRANNRNVGGGNIDENETGEMLLVEGIGRTATIGELENIVLRAEQGVPVCVRDVAQVTIGHQIRTGTVTSGGKGEVVLGLGFMLMGQNSYAVTRALKQRLEEVKRALPASVKVTTVYDRSQLVEHVIATVRSSLSEGALLVVAVVFFFLGNLRAGLIVALAIPLSMLFAFSGMLQMGIAGTLLSLGAIDFGIVVDSCIVVVENIIEHLEADPAANRLETVRRATSEVRQPAIFGQLIIAVVYLPILTLEGVEGRMFRPMAWTVILVLAGSLLMSLTLVPVLASFLLPSGAKRFESGTVLLAERAYAPLLRRALAHPVWVLTGGLALLVTAGSIVGRLGSEFTARLSEGDIVIGIRRPAGTDLAESTRINSLMEKILLAEFPHEISHIWSRNGAPEVATDAGDVQTTDMCVALRPRADWQVARTQMELVAKMHAAVGQLPGQTTWFTQPIEQRINEMVSGVRSDVAIKLFGDDFDTLVAEARRLEAVLSAVPGCQDLAVEQIQGQPLLRIKVQQDQIARYGLPVDRVLDVVEAVGSKPLGEVIEGERRVPLVARLPETLCHSAAQLASVILLTPSGERLPLDHLAKVEKTFGPKMISRESGRRRITVQCNVRDRDVGGFVADAQRAVHEQIQLPPGYWLQWGGQFENIERAQRRLLLVVPLSLGLITGLLFLAYRTAGDTLVVLASVPMACAGGVIALALRQMPLSISATVGFITLSGVSVLNSMLILSAVRLRTAAGMPVATALFQAMTTRLRTVMMTTLVASAGFAPMAFSDGVGAEVQRPLATVVIGGVLSSTLLTLLVLPVLYAAMRRRWPLSEPAARRNPTDMSDPADSQATLTTVT
jgi:cobalt-zinc-cadmium resistance protein CzcA